MKIAKCGGLKFDTEAFKEIDGVITLSENDELTGEAFIAPLCGGIKFDGGIFDNVKIGERNVITEVDETPTNYIVASCGLLFDADIFEINDDGAITLI